MHEDFLLGWSQEVVTIHCVRATARCNNVVLTRFWVRSVSYNFGSTWNTTNIYCFGIIHPLHILLDLGILVASPIFRAAVDKARKCSASTPWQWGSVCGPLQGTVHRTYQDWGWCYLVYSSRGTCWHAMCCMLINPHVLQDEQEQVVDAAENTCDSQQGLDCADFRITCLGVGIHNMLC